MNITALYCPTLDTVKPIDTDYRTKSWGNVWSFRTNHPEMCHSDHSAMAQLLLSVLLSALFYLH